MNPRAMGCGPTDVPAENRSGMFVLDHVGNMLHELRKAAQGLSVKDRDSSHRRRALMRHLSRDSRIASLKLALIRAHSPSPR
jgi:hypothetical protein